MLVSVFGEHLLPCTSNLCGPTWHAAQPPSPQIDIGPSPDFDQQVVGGACIGKGNDINLSYLHRLGAYIIFL